MDSKASQDRFFVLKKGALRSRYDVDVDTVEPIHLGEAARCPSCHGFISLRPWLPPLRCDLVLHGEELGDFIQSDGNEVLISERFARAFNNEMLTGLTGFHPVDVRRVRRGGRGPRPNQNSDYFAVTPCFGRAAVDVAHSRIRYSRPVTCEECRSAGPESIHGFTLEVETWKGEDIFYPRGLSGVLTVSQRFERFVARHGFTNLRLTPIEEYLWDPRAPHPLPGTPEGSA